MTKKAAKKEPEAVKYRDTLVLTIPLWLVSKLESVGGSREYVMVDDKFEREDDDLHSSIELNGGGCVMVPYRGVLEIDLEMDELRIYAPTRVK